jgi:hypothetical protein
MSHETTTENYEKQSEVHGSEYIGEAAAKKIQERCQKIRKSSNPLCDAVKIAVYINCLINLLREQGFEYKHENNFDQSKSDTFEVTEVKSGKKVKCEILDDLFEVIPFVKENEIQDSSSTDEETNSTSSEDDVEMMDGIN